MQVCSAYFVLECLLFSFNHERERERERERGERARERLVIMAQQPPAPNKILIVGTSLY